MYVLFIYSLNEFKELKLALNTSEKMLLISDIS